MTINQSKAKINNQSKTPDLLGGFVAHKRISEKKLPELLAPAGSPKALWAAIAAGADAVYFALPDFNARINADNFTRESFLESVELCHKYGVKAYITLNTQIYDREKSDFLESALYAYRSGVDAAIVGDLGCAAMIKKYIPDMEIHASTQLSGHNSDAGVELSRLGFTRMVCAREMSLDDISAFVENSPIEAEIFVHGALCVCHSGQCLFSSLVGGRSGNRGLCAQPCRLPYKSESGSSGYHLSLKDMCLASHIPEIIESGVASLKIEGRMKGAEYVYGVISIYRRLLDERRAATREELSELSAIFSRGGFTDGYFKKEISHKMLGIRSEKDKELSRSATATAEYEPRRMGLSLVAEIRRNEPMRLTLSTDAASGERLGRELSVDAVGDVPLIAQNRPTDLDAAKKNLLKFGSTAYKITDCKITLDDGLMVPVSALNSLRRAASEAMDREVLKPYDTRKDAVLTLPKNCAALIKNNDTNCAALSTERPECDAEKSAPRRTASFMRVRNIPVSAKDYFDIIFLAATEFTEGNAAKIRELSVNGIMLPPVIFDSEREAIKKHLDAAKKAGVRYALVGNLGHLPLADEYGFLPMGDFRLNVSNTETATLLTETVGLTSVTLSPELTLPRVRTISKNSPASVIAYGRVPLMIVEKCVISELYPCGYAKNGGAMCKACATDTAKLIDRTGTAFPVMREFSHRNVIYNSLPTYMADKERDLPSIDECTRHFIFTTESSVEVSSVIEAYKNNSPADRPVRRIGV